VPLALLEAANNDLIPQRIGLAAASVHHSRHVCMNLGGVQRTAIVSSKVFNTETKMKIGRKIQGKSKDELDSRITKDE
jgi:hypothetical protein